MIAFFLSKLLPLFVYPLGLACVLLAAALILGRYRRVQWTLIALSLAVLWLSGNRLATMAAVRSLEWRYLPQAEIPAAEVIVVLGGGERSRTPPRPIHEINEAGDRLLYAAYLYKAGKAPHILLSGGVPVLMGPGVMAGSQVMAETLELMGVPPDALWHEPRSLNTYENAVESRAILAERGIDRIILVTSAMHMPRASALFARQGFDVIPAPTDFFLTEADWEFYTQPSLEVQIFNLLPSAQDLELISNVIREYMGIWVARLRGQI
ncbi:MAG: YdcF family protein [Caldilineaceae bacterium]|nr:YdcF family protein [Caldilineaceae bacterium]